jgi:hypothetical protein
MGLRGDRRTRLLAAFAVGILISCLWLAFVVFSLVRATSDLREGRKAADTARHRDPLTLLDDSTVALLRTADRRFVSAHHTMTSPVLFPARLLPVLGRNLRSAEALSSAASRIATVGIQGLVEAHGVLATSAGAGNARVAAVRQVADLAMRTDSRLTHVDLGPNVGLLGPLAEARADLARGLTELRQALAGAATTATTVSDLLAGPSHYLVMGANNAEMRAGSGMFLSIGELETDAGRITLGDLKSVSDVAVPPGVAVTGDLADRWGWLNPGQVWQSLMASPRFDESARLAADMWVASGRSPVDGVLAIDPAGLKALLAVTGPVTVDDRQIDADNVIEELVYRQYARFTGDQAERREELGRIARSAFTSLEGGGWSPIQLAGSLAKAISGRHLMAWSSNPRQQAGWETAGAAGAVRPDSLLVSVLNRGASKLDRWLGVDANLTVEPKDGQTECILRLTLSNQVPPDAPSYVLGPYDGVSVPAGTYLGLVAVNLPGAALDSRVDGVDNLAVAGADGPTRVVGFQLQVPRSGEQEVTVRFRLPAGHGSIRVEPSARIPAMAWRSGATSWDDGAAHHLEW